MLVLDEPTAFLDIAGRVELTLIVADLAGDGLTVVVSTHDLDLALSHADRVWLVADATVTDNSPADLANGGALTKAFLPADHGAEHAATFEAVVTALHRTTRRDVPALWSRTRAATQPASRVKQRSGSLRASCDLDAESVGGRRRGCRGRRTS